MTRRSFSYALLSAGLGVACSSPELDGTNFACETDSDCGSGQMCAPLNGAQACMDIPDGPIRIGMSAPLQGPSEALGIEMRRGINAMLQRFNDEGGLAGRPVVLESLNDNYDPATAVEMTRRLLDVRQVVDDMNREDIRGNNSVFALVGNVGTPTMLATAPIATKNKVVFFGPFTGSQEYLRDETNSPYVYNYRAGYFDEARAMVDYIYRSRTPRVVVEPTQDYRRILVFAQEDSYGDAGYRGVVTAYNETVAPLPNADSIARVGYIREDVDSVDPAVVEAGEFLEGVLDRAPDPDSTESVAIIMIDTYQPGNRFIRGLKDWINADAARARRLDVLFMNVSFVGSDSLASELTTFPETYTDINTGMPRSYADDVIVTQVVPYYESQAAGVAQYREDLREFDSGSPSFTSLEGYIVARLFTEALRLNGPNLTTPNFIQTLDTQITDLDIGIGTPLNFSPSNHQACNTVWGTLIQPDGTFEVPFVWNRDEGIQTTN